MPVTNKVVSVGTAVVELSGPHISSKYVYLQDGDFDGDSIIYVGGSAVSAADGIMLSKTTPSVFETNADDSIYAICSAADGSVRVIEVK